MKSNLPSGTVTFLFTDIENSIQLRERNPEAMKATLARHDELLRRAIESHNGYVIKTTSDGIHAVFASVNDGLDAAIAGQRMVQAETWSKITPIKVRVALHTGEAQARAGDYFGLAVNRVTQLVSVASGGQIVISQATADLIRDSLPHQVTLHDLGEHHLTDAIRPEHVFQVIAADLPADFPPLKSLEMRHWPLATKTFLPPVPEYHISRPRLEQRLNAALRSRHKLILVSAPPGSGKSSLMAAWAAQRAIPLAWVSLEASDNDPARFWSYFLAAIQTRFPDAVQAMLVDLNASPAISPTLLPEVINLLSCQPEPLVVALDDYHTIENPDIHQGVLYLLEHIPAHICLAITTRIDPPLPVHRWRARSQLTEIRAADLRFTLAEASDFLTRRMGLNLEPADIQKLEARTEGWATGLQLAALSMQGRTDNQAFIEQFSGSHHFVLEYLMNEVLARQSENIQRFLVYTSILESFSASLCEQVLVDVSREVRGEADQDADSILASLEHANLFLIPLNEEHTWFRYHHLFASFLNQRLKREEPETVRRLHQRAAEWFSENAWVDEAIQHALAAANLRFATDVIRNHWQAASSEGRARAVARWIEMLPEQQVAGDTQLSFVYAWMLLAIGKTASLETHIHNVRSNLVGEKATSLDPERRNSLLGQLAALRAMQAARVGDLASATQFVEEARQSSSPEDATVRGLAWLVQANVQRELGDFEESIAGYREALPRLPYTGLLSGTWIMVIALSQAYLVQGQVQAAEELCRTRLAQAVESGQDRVPAIGILQIELARIEYERNRLAEARSLFEKGEANSKRSGMVDLLTSTALLGARLDRLDGELRRAIQRLQDALQAVRRADSPDLSTEISAWLVRFQAEAELLTEAAAWAKDIRPRLDHNPGYTHGLELFSLLRVLICQGWLDEALDLATRLEVLASGGHSLGRMIEARMLQAEILWRQGRQEDGMNRLADSIELAERTGMARLFLDEGSRLSPVLAAWQTSGKLLARRTGYAGWLLNCFRQEASRTLPGQAEALSDRALREQDVPELTRRERDVLLGLVQGLSYPEMAERLVISVGTVKTHVSHIYSKLGVQGRIEAIHRAQELKLL
ncbi:MAG TPA: LuxR C-terminal-related transcriptional regulator [Aggregatilineaceae bacterium]|nr:LuxR C-terminal-related transcriptional regulator [Aggregatilineaceae bacterium]